MEDWMKFTVETGDLLKALLRTNNVVPSKSTLPILENILFDLDGNMLTMTATDLEVSISISLTVKGNINGKIAVPAKRLMETVRTLTETPILFTADLSNNKLKMITATGEYRLTGEVSTEFPTIPEFKEGENIIFENQMFRRLIQKTVFAVSGDELRPAMMGVMLQIKPQEVCAAATDGHRLVRMVTKKISGGEQTREVIIPIKALNLIAKFAEDGSTTISLNESHIRFAFENTVLISRIIQEKYPNYESVIPLENDKKLVVAKESLIASVRRVALYSSSTTHQIRFQVRKEDLRISAEDVDFGGEANEKISCDYSADELEIGFNANYVIDILAHIDSDEILFTFSNPTRAAIVQPLTQRESEDILMLVMPIRLNG
jgi:DNA polymerase-3 subunit beta